MCLTLGIISNNNNKEQIKHNIGQILEEPVFVESLYNAIFLKAKNLNILQNKKTMNILIELEKIRLLLEK